MQDVSVTLSGSEVMQAAIVGVMRRLQNQKHSRAGKYGCKPSDPWAVDIEGACSEFAVAKYLGKFWSGALGDYKADDVGVLQVRSTPRLSGRLILHPDDADDRIFILVRGVSPTFTLAGWIEARDGKQQQFWDDPSGGRPAYFIPQSALRPISELAISGLA